MTEDENEDIPNRLNVPASPAKPYQEEESEQELESEEEVVSSKSIIKRNQSNEMTMRTPLDPIKHKAPKATLPTPKSTPKAKAKPIPKSIVKSNRGTPVKQRENVSVRAGTRGSKAQGLRAVAKK